MNSYDFYPRCCLQLNLGLLFDYAPTQLEMSKFEHRLEIECLKDIPCLSVDINIYFLIDFGCFEILIEQFL